MDDATGQFVGSIAVEVGVVVDGLGLVGEGVGRVVHEGLHGGFGTEGFEEGFGHRVEVDEGYVLGGGDFAHGVRISGEGVGYFAVGVKGAAVHAGDEDRCGLFGAGLSDVVGE